MTTTGIYRNIKGLSQLRLTFNVHYWRIKPVKLQWMRFIVWVYFQLRTTLMGMGIHSASELRLEFLEHWDDIFGTVKEWSTHVDQARGLLSSAQTSLENLRTAKRYATQEHLKIGLGFLEPEPKGQRNKVAKRKAKEERIKAAQAKKAGSGSKD
ncbi:hypothetical protein N7462_007566 [Penicillium macrosclerotiorum]|uniref:uncharacterized protein n=1 Tax=Penicillium macrosclerotiorum TaxID=303699 RepID=UPI002549C0C2|nr:uncharacterized protein N7462_007566 [Penicillium macrosclerotiorum]KAJ5679322.1 hypothetical protein N7462_007566 [Penicillium macrosclerotiorum]